MATISLAPPLRSIMSRRKQSAVGAPVGFARMTRVCTLMGWQAIDSLMAGDLVLDIAGDLHELRGIRQLQVLDAPMVRIARKGRAPLVVGAGQTVRVDDWRAQVIYGQATACPVARLVDNRTVRHWQPQIAVLVQPQFDTTVCLDIDGAQAIVTPVRLAWTEPRAPFVANPLRSGRGQSFGHIRRVTKHL